MADSRECFPESDGVVIARSRKNDAHFRHLFGCIGIEMPRVVVVVVNGRSDQSRSGGESGRHGGEAEGSRFRI